jgi:hypothetical protein
MIAVFLRVNQADKPAHKIHCRIRPHSAKHARAFFLLPCHGSSSILLSIYAGKTLAVNRFTAGMTTGMHYG